jgi:hypothetical protein
VPGRGCQALDLTAGRSGAFRPQLAWDPRLALCCQACAPSACVPGAVAHA